MQSDMGAAKKSSAQGHLGKGKRRVGRPAKVSRDKIIDAVLEVGIMEPRFTKIAEKLGVTVSALYRHVKDMDELVFITADKQLRRFPIPPDNGEDWLDWAFEFGLSVKRFFSTFPGFAEFSISRIPRHLAVLERHETSIKIALRSGFNPVEALWATRGVINHVHLSVAREERQAFTKDESGVEHDQDLLDFMQTLPKSADLTHLTTSLEQAAKFSAQELFEYQLRALIIGFGAQVDARKERSLSSPQAGSSTE